MAGEGVQGAPPLGWLLARTVLDFLNDGQVGGVGGFVQ